ncbi:Atu4866 domain-containing protein [Nonomuraea sp. KM88]|uniref:Atu4866 domain-containing protein n=1 Tax=Nonomuraea sp. KM88 TaxID=3457427 RepID=UPI003FCE8C44
MSGNDASDPLVVIDATVHVTPSRTVRGDLWAEDGRITHVGPRGKKPRPARARVIEADGAFVVPLLVDTAMRARAEDQRGVYDVAPGNPATFAVTRERMSESRIGQMLVLRPYDLLAVVVWGHVEAWQGEPTRPAGTPAPGLQRWHGVWVDESHELEQHLLLDGRYTETRHGRTDAYTGRYWVRDDRVTYLDDTGFWAFGELVDGVLHHAGFVMRKRLTPG